MQFPYGGYKETIPADSGLALGYNPTITHCEFAHGSGGGTFSISTWFNDWEYLWKQAGEITQYLPGK